MLVARKAPLRRLGRRPARRHILRQYDVHAALVVVKLQRRTGESRDVSRAHSGYEPEQQSRREQSVARKHNRNHHRPDDIERHRNVMLRRLAGVSRGTRHEPTPTITQMPNCVQQFYVIQARAASSPKLRTEVAQQSDHRPHISAAHQHVDIGSPCRGVRPELRE